MAGPMARVLFLPTETDLREEADRMGVPPAELARWLGPIGATALKLNGVPTDVAAALASTVPEGCGAVFAAPDHVDAMPRPASQPSALSTQHSALVVAAPAPLLLDIASRLDSMDTAGRALASEIRRALHSFAGRDRGTTRCGDLTMEWGKRSYVMGIINVTPDSFSGDGVGDNVDAAVAQARRLVEEGADLLDVGGESTRPGSKPVTIQEEKDRVLPVIARLVTELRTPVSIDSYKPEVVRAALDAGASAVNDIWGLRKSEAIADLAAAHGVPLILMHNRRAEAASGKLGGHFREVGYVDLMGEIAPELRESVEMALARGVKQENLIIDPGIGFGKTPAHNLVVMRRLRELTSLGYPILMGTSRKSVIGLTLGVPMDQRVEGTAATVAVSICNGADIVRVHDVREMVRVARMTDAIVRARE